METTVTSEGQLTLPQKIRHAHGLDASPVLEVEHRAEGSFVLRKKTTPSFFDQFIGLKARNAPLASGLAAHVALRVGEAEPALSLAGPRAQSHRNLRKRR